MVSLKKVLRNPTTGKEAKKSFPTEADISSEQKETIENVILNCLAAYPVVDKKQMFLVNAVSTAILNTPDGKIEFSEDQMTFLEKVLWKSVYKSNEKKGKDGSAAEEGIYFSWVIAQVLIELGITE